MRFLNVLLSVALAFKATNSKAIDYNLLRRNANTEFIENDGFKITYHCVEDYNNKCSSYKKDLKDAIDILSSTFEFYQQVSIEVFVDDAEKYLTCNIGGFADDINYVVLKTSNETDAIPYSYTQALAKQLNLNVQPDYKDYDFTILLNNLICTEGKDNVDFFSKAGFVRTIIHEIIHGFGFMTASRLHDFFNTNLYDVPHANLKTLEINDISSKNTVSFVPLPIIEYNTDIFRNAKTIDDYIRGSALIKINGFYPLSAFEKNIVDMNTKERIFKNLGSIYKEYNKCIPNGSVLLNEFTEKVMSECYQNFSNEVKASLAPITHYYSSFESIGILTNDGRVEPLFTFDGYYNFGSSVHHTDYKQYPSLLYCLNNNPELKARYNQAEFFDETSIETYIDEEYVMYYRIDDNISKDLFLRTVGKNNKHGLIGQGIVEILKSIGWTEKGEQRSNDMYYVDESFIIPPLEVIKYMVSSFHLSDNVNEAPINNTPTETQVDRPMPTEIQTPIETQIPMETSTVVETEITTPSTDDIESMDEVEVIDIVDSDVKEEDNNDSDFDSSEEN